jgi:hypothetical protein
MAPDERTECIFKTVSFKFPVHRDLRDPNEMFEVTEHIDSYDFTQTQTQLLHLVAKGCDSLITWCLNE